MTADGQEPRQRVRAFIQEAGIGMLTTLDIDGQVVSRPMLALLLDEDPGVYFLTHSSSAKIRQLAAEPRGSDVHRTGQRVSLGYRAGQRRCRTSR